MILRLEEDLAWSSHFFIRRNDYRRKQERKRVSEEHPLHVNALKEDVDFTLSSITAEKKVLKSSTG